MELIPAHTALRCRAGRGSKQLSAAHPCLRWPSRAGKEKQLSVPSRDISSFSPKFLVLCSSTELVLGLDTTSFWPHRVPSPQASKWSSLSLRPGWAEPEQVPWQKGRGQWDCVTLRAGPSLSLTSQGEQGGQGAAAALKQTPTVRGTPPALHDPAPVRNKVPSSSCI